MTEIEMERDLAQSACTAWQHVFKSIEAHIQDRIAMRDPANPETYLSIIRSAVANVERDSHAIVNARWADSARYQEQIAMLEAAQPRLFSGCLRDGVCRGVCRTTDCPNYDLVVAARLVVEPKQDGILYSEEIQ